MYDHWQLIDNQNKQTNTLIDTSIVHGITNHIRILYKAKDSAKSSSNVANFKINRLSRRNETRDGRPDIGDWTRVCKWSHVWLLMLSQHKCWKYSMEPWNRNNANKLIQSRVWQAKCMAKCVERVTKKNRQETRFDFELLNKMIACVWVFGKCQVYTHLVLQVNRSGWVYLFQFPDKTNQNQSIRNEPDYECEWKLIEKVEKYSWSDKLPDIRINKRWRRRRNENSWHKRSN